MQVSNTSTQKRTYATNADAKTHAKILYKEIFIHSLLKSYTHN